MTIIRPCKHRWLADPQKNDGKINFVHYIIHFTKPYMAGKRTEEAVSIFWCRGHANTTIYSMLSKTRQWKYSTL